MPELSLLDVFYPFLLLLAAGGFWTVHGLRPEMRSPFWFAFAFLFGAAAFSIEFLRFVLHDSAQAVLAVGFYSAMGAFLVCGLILRAGREPPFAMISGIAIGCTAAVFVFALIGVHVLLRVFTAQFSISIMLLIGVGYARHRFQTTTDKALLTVVGLMSVLLLVHPVIVGYYAGLPATSMEYDTSALFLTMGLLTMVMALLCAVLLVREAVVIIIGDLKALANRDELTGILNRRGLDEAVSDLVKNTLDSDRAVAVLAIDIDLFKLINDTYGHGFGDTVIHSLGQMLRAHGGDEGLAVRVGGEEFVLVMPVTSLEEACQIAEVLRQRWARQTFFANDADVRSTASFGVALHRADQPISNTLVHADKALYHAKQTGRNKVSSEQDLQESRMTQAPVSQSSGDVDSRAALKFSG